MQATHGGLPAEGQVGCRNGNASLYYKSRPEGTWVGSPHDTSPTRLTASVPSDAELRSKARQVRGGLGCHGTARCTAASYKGHFSRQGLRLMVASGPGSFGAAPLLMSDWHGITGAIAQVVIPSYSSRQAVSPIPMPHARDMCRRPRDHHLSSLGGSQPLHRTHKPKSARLKRARLT